LATKWHRWDTQTNHIFRINVARSLRDPEGDDVALRLDGTGKKPKAPIRGFILEASVRADSVFFSVVRGWTLISGYYVEVIGGFGAFTASPGLLDRSFCFAGRD
jgi:hypothetical protein